MYQLMREFCSLLILFCRCANYFLITTIVNTPGMFNPDAQRATAKAIESNGSAIGRNVTFVVT